MRDRRRRDLEPPAASDIEPDSTTKQVGAEVAGFHAPDCDCGRAMARAAGRKQPVPSVRCSALDTDVPSRLAASCALAACRRCAA